MRLQQSNILAWLQNKVIKMKIDVVDLENKEVKKIDLPTQFNEEIRQDLIKRDFLAIRANTRQGYGASPEAGKKSSNTMSRRRRDYKTSYDLIKLLKWPMKLCSKFHLVPTTTYDKYFKCV